MYKDLQKTFGLILQNFERKSYFLLTRIKKNGKLTLHFDCCNSMAAQLSWLQRAVHTRQVGGSNPLAATITTVYGSVVQRLGHHPFTVVTRVRVPPESPAISSCFATAFLFFEKTKAHVCAIAGGFPAGRHHFPHFCLCVHYIQMRNAHQRLCWLLAILVRSYHFFISVYLGFLQYLLKILFKN